MQIEIHYQPKTHGRTIATTTTKNQNELSIQQLRTTCRIQCGFSINLVAGVVVLVPLCVCVRFQFSSYFAIIFFLNGFHMFVLSFRWIAIAQFQSAVLLFFSCFICMCKLYDSIETLTMVYLLTRDNINFLIKCARRVYEATTKKRPKINSARLIRNDKCI